MKEFSPLRARGQSMTEVAFILPLVLALILGAVDVAQVLSAQQHLENAAYLAALRLRSTPGLGAPTRLATFMQAESGLAPVSAASRYGMGGAGADQVVVTATYAYPLLLPGLGKLLTGTSGSGTWNLTVSASSIAATDPPSLTDTSGTVKAVPPSGTTVPSGLTLTCALYQNGAPVPTPQPCASATWSHPATGATYTYTATAMQVNGVTSPPSTPVTGP